MEKYKYKYLPIIFSIGLPSVYYEKESEDKWCLPKEGVYMRKSFLFEFDTNKVKGWYKSSLPYVQFFNTGYRVTSNNIDWSSWNNCCFIDIDTKKYKDINNVNLDIVEKNIFKELCEQYGANFYCMQRSWSSTSFHFVFYYSCEKNENNFKKAQQLSMKKILDVFKKTNNLYLLLDENNKINKKVVDECCISPYQGMYLSSFPIHFNEHISGDSFELEFEEIKTKEDYRKEKLEKGFIDTLNDDFEFISNDIRFQWYPNNIQWEHHTRLRIAAFIYKLMNGDKEKTIETYCKYIVPYIKEKGIDCIGSNHSERELRNLIKSQFNDLKKWQLSDYMLRFGCKIFGIRYKYTDSHIENRNEAKKTYIPKEIKEMSKEELIKKIKSHNIKI